MTGPPLVSIAVPGARSTPFLECGRFGPIGSGLIGSGKNAEGFPLEGHTFLHEFQVSEQRVFGGAYNIPDPGGSCILECCEFIEFGGQILR